VLLLGALALTACQSASGDSADGVPPSHQPSSAAAAPTGSTESVSAPSASPSKGAAGQNSTSAKGASTRAPGGTSAGGTSGGGNDTDAYAFKHPCTSREVSVHVTGRAGAPSRRVIVVRGLTGHACGLSYYPLVSLDNSRAPGGKVVKPLIPSGLGGPPAYVLHAGRTAYAVIDLDPSGATAGTVPGIDELNVLADGDHMPNADTLNFPLGPGAHVLKPKLGLYRTTVADAVSSMESADYQS
ncbi:MAG TPA: hypothetical protein VGL02_16825, partial [Streptomyces sp.]